MVFKPNQFLQLFESELNLLLLLWLNFLCAV